MLMLSDGVFDGLMQRFDDKIEQPMKHPLFALEVVIEHGVCDIGLLHDLAHAGGGVAFLAKEASGGDENARSVLVEAALNERRDQRGRRLWRGGGRGTHRVGRYDGEI